ncbi:MAG: alpha/beta hydrolase, partial [Blastomonas sp.]|nr:alpha/beta hydrolase [Blastomonas sp.]
RPHRLYLTIANEGREMQTGVDRLTAALGTSKRTGQDWCYAPHPDQTHATIYHSVSPEALQFLFPTSVEQDPKSGFDLSCQSPKS